MVAIDQEVFGKDPSTDSAYIMETEILGPGPARASTPMPREWSVETQRPFSNHWINHSTTATMHGEEPTVMIF